MAYLFQLSRALVQQEESTITSHPKTVLAVGENGTNSIVGDGIVLVINPVPAYLLLVTTKVLHTHQPVGTTHPKTVLSVAIDAEQLIARALACDGRQCVGGQQVIVDGHRYPTVGAYPNVVVMVAKEAPHGIARQRFPHSGIVQNMMDGLVLLNDVESIVCTHQEVALLVDAETFGHRNRASEGFLLPPAKR